MNFCKDLSLEILVPNNDAFVLDQSRLNQNDALAPVPSGDDYVWTEVLGDTSSIQISRGADTNLGVFARAEAGEMQFTYMDTEFNPFYKRTIDPNSPVRLKVKGLDNPNTYTELAGQRWYYDPEVLDNFDEYEDLAGVKDQSEIVLFTGVVRAVDAQFVKDGPTAVNISCVDDVARLNTEKPGPLPQQTWLERFEDLVTGSGIEGSTGPDLYEDDIRVVNRSLGSEYSYWDMFYMNANGVRGFVSMLRDGSVYSFNDYRDLVPLIDFTDVGSDDPNHSCFSELQFAYDSTATINDSTLR